MNQSLGRSCGMPWFWIQGLRQSDSGPIGNLQGTKVADLKPEYLLRLRDRVEEVAEGAKTLWIENMNVFVICTKNKV